MPNERFHNLVRIIFKNTFGIKEDKNAARYGAFPDLFPSYQLGRDLDKIKKGETIDPVNYNAALERFFNTDNPDCIENTIFLIKTLETEGYITGLDGFDLLNKCDQNTIKIYQQLLQNIWNFYFEQYPEPLVGNKIIYSITSNEKASIVEAYSKYHLPVSLEFYQERIPHIIELIKTKKPESLCKDSIQTEYIYFFKNVLENKSFYTLSVKDRTIFFNTLYAMSDILDRIHHKDSYSINLEILSFLSQIYDDNFNFIDINDIRRIQGCIYAISIESTEESLKGNIKLTRNNNLTKKDTGIKPITAEEKIGICSVALKNLLCNKKLNKLDHYFKEENYISLFENRLKKPQLNVSHEDINELQTLSLVYANIAACTLQYIKNKINMNTQYNTYIETCKIYHDRSGYIRNLICRLTQKGFGPNSPEYIDALHFLAAHYHSLATKYYYLKRYNDSITIRSVLYSFYKYLGLSEKVQMQLDLAPVTLYEQSGGNNDIYQIDQRYFFNNHKKDFSLLHSPEMMSYDNFRKIKNEYEQLKTLL